jgi:hypothetical protein
MESLEEDEEVIMNETADDIRMEITNEESMAIIDARILTMDELRVLRSKKSTNLTKEDQHSIHRAYTVATFGDIVVDNIGADHMAITNIKNQMKFRELCLMDEPNNSFLCKLFGGEAKTFEDYVDIGHHKPAEQYAMCMILNTFGFNSITDKTTVTLDDEKRVKTDDTVKGYKRLMKTGQKVSVVVDCIKAAVAITGQQWGINPKQVVQKGKKAKQYTLEPCGDGLHWGTPTWERHKAYQEYYCTCKPVLAVPGHQDI